MKKKIVRKTKGTADATDKQVGLNIRQWRNARGISQETLGDAVGVTFQQVQKYERGTNRISASRLITLAKTLKVTPATLLGVPDEALTKLPKGDLEIVEKISTLNKDQRRIISMLINNYVKSNEGTKADD